MCMSKTGCEIAHHGSQALVEGNLVEFHAMDRFSNPRLNGTDALASNFLSSSAVIDSVVAGENGVYTFNYWWQYATFNQHIIFCPVDGLTEWTVSTTACYDTSTACVEDPAGLIAELSTMPEADAATPNPAAPTTRARTRTAAPTTRGRCRRPASRTRSGR